MTDESNQKFDSSQVKQKYILVFFGYTTCKTICPTTLNNLSIAFEENKKLKDKFKPVFISINAESPEDLKEYSKAFSSQLTMLTGSNQEIERILENYKVFRVKDEKTNEINHTGFIYIMNKNGEYLDSVMGNNLKTLQDTLADFNK